MYTYIESFEQLKKFYNKNMNGFMIYGAGEMAVQLTTIIYNIYGTTDIIKGYIVSKIQDKNSLFGKKIIEFDFNKIDKDSNIVIALGNQARKEVLDAIEGVACNIFVVNTEIMTNDDCKAIIYNDCIKDIKGYIETLDRKAINYDMLINDEKNIYSWTCWWQGEENAPEIVKACINSQRKNLPSEIQHIVITKYNYKNYIDFPNYILTKVDRGDITYTTFSDMIREKLIYKYGGIWFDATVLIHKPFPKKYFELDLFTCKAEKYGFCSYSKWSLWCMGAKKKNNIYKFLYESFEYYYKYNQTIKYYLTVDYFIMAAMEYINGAREQYEAIPCNNSNADILAPHLKDIFEEKKWLEYTEDTYISKLTYKHFSGRNGKDFRGFDKKSIYQFIIDKYI